MKTKNCKVRTGDIKSGVIIYVAHPVYGIDKFIVTSKPYKSKYTGSLFADAIKVYGLSGKGFKDHFSLKDAGITKGASYNYRRSFFKLKQAEEWISKMVTDPGFIESQARHEAMCDDLDDIYACEGY